VLGQLPLQLVAATAMAAFTIMVHLAGLASLIALMRLHDRDPHTRRARDRQVAVMLLVVFGLFGLHGAEIWSYALLYKAVGATSDFEQALYFSTTIYVTIGYGDLTLTKAWRILGAIEGANGIILLGWSTAFFVSVVGRLRWLEHDAAL
jgi:hypothetical protein